MGNYSQFFKDVADIPIVDVIGSRIPLKQRGNYYEALCPFHGDKSLGSFKVNKAKNSWRCYACGEGGGAAAFVARYDGVSLFAASVRLGVEYGLISSADGETMLKGKEVKYAPKKRVVQKPIPPNLPRETEHSVRVYDAFVAASGELTADQLTHLHEIRHADGWENEFFRWPNPKNPAFWAKFTRELKAHGVTEPLVSAIRYVPGFAFNLETMRPYFMTGIGIGIRLHDMTGQTTGLQLRADNAPKGTRYRLFSSGWAEMNSEETLYAFDGASVPQVLDVLLPKDGNPVRAAVTEGRYKAIQLAKRGYAVLSLNGVQNYALVLPEFLNNLAELGISDVDVYFDSDMFEKLSVARASIGIAETLQKAGVNPYFVTWDPKLGKGIDDVLIAGYHKRLYRRTGIQMVKELTQKFVGQLKPTI